MNAIKIGRILDEPDGVFAFEYDDTLGKKQCMRLEAATYDTAIREAKSFLEINPDDRDPDGSQWDIE